MGNHYPTDLAASYHINRPSKTHNQPIISATMPHADRINSTRASFRQMANMLVALTKVTSLKGHRHEGTPSVKNSEAGLDPMTDPILYQADRLHGLRPHLTKGRNPILLVCQPMKVGHQSQHHDHLRGHQGRLVLSASHNLGRRFLGHIPAWPL